MTSAEKLEALNQWQLQHSNLERLQSKVHAAFGSTPDSEFFETCWGLFDELTNATSLAIGDGNTWLEWYWSENDMGKKGLPVNDGNGKLIKKVKNLSDLLEVIES